MTGLTPDDILRLMTGLSLTRKWNADRETADAEQEARIVAVLRDDSDARMLLEVAKQDMAKLRSELDAAKVENVNITEGLQVAVEAIASFCDSARRLRENI